MVRQDWILFARPRDGVGPIAEEEAKVIRSNMYPGNVLEIEVNISMTWQQPIPHLACSPC